MSQGTPGIVFSDSPGIAEHIEDGKSGFIVADLEDLTHKIRILINDKIMRDTMGQNARIRVTSRYTLEKMVSAYDRLYDSVFALSSLTHNLSARQHQ